MKEIDFPKIVLQERDRKIIEFLKSQGAATLEQLLIFFPNYKLASRRIIKLEKAGIIKGYLPVQAVGFNEIKNKYLPVLLDIRLRPSTKIFKLSPIYLGFFTENAKFATRVMTLHQLMLNDVRFYLEKIFKDNLFLNDVDIHFMAKTYNNKEPLVPDLTIISGHFKIAIELERNLKSKSQYSVRMARYSASAYTHVLFFYSKESYLETLINCSRPYRNIGLVDIFTKDMVYSNAFGKLKLHDWLVKIDELKSRSTSESKYKMYQPNQ